MIQKKSTFIIFYFSTLLKDQGIHHSFTKEIRTCETIFFSFFRKLFVKGERSKERVQRNNSTIVEFQDGEVFDSSITKSASPPDKKKPGLFMQDLQLFEAQICRERPADEHVAMCIRCIEIAEEAHKLLK